MPSNPDEPPHQLRRTRVAVRIGRMQEFAEMGYAIICKSCSNSTLNLQLALEARISRHLSLRGRGMSSQHQLRRTAELDGSHEYKTLHPLVKWVLWKDRKSCGCRCFVLFRVQL